MALGQGMEIAREGRRVHVTAPQPDRLSMRLQTGETTTEAPEDVHLCNLYSAAKSGARIQPERTGATGPRLERGRLYLNSEGQ